MACWMLSCHNQNYIPLNETDEPYRTVVTMLWWLENKEFYSNRTMLSMITNKTHKLHTILKNFSCHFRSILRWIPNPENRRICSFNACKWCESFALKRNEVKLVICQLIRFLFFSRRLSIYWSDSWLNLPKSEIPIRIIWERKKFFFLSILEAGKVPKIGLKIHS